MRLSDEANYLLDLLRALAAQVVLVAHTMSYLKVGFSDSPLARIGVVVFFALSGFLIANSITTAVSHGSPFSHWIIKRFARIYAGLLPALIFILIVDLILTGISGFHPYAENFNTYVFLANIAMLQNHTATYPWFESAFFTEQAFGTGRPLWTISIEWWLYMSFGMVCFLRSNIWKNGVLLTVFILLSTVPVLNILATYAGGLALVWLLGAVSVFAAGAFEFRSLRFGILLSVGIVFSILAAVQLSMTENLYSTPGTNPYDIRFMVFLTISILAFIFSAQMPGNYTSQRIIGRRFIGNIANFSYTLYLTHYTVLVFLDAVLTMFHPYIVFCLTLIISNSLAYYIALFTENRHRALAKALIEHFERVRKHMWRIRQT